MSAVNPGRATRSAYHSSWWPSSATNSLIENKAPVSKTGDFADAVRSGAETGRRRSAGRRQRPPVPRAWIPFVARPDTAPTSPIKFQSLDEAKEEAADDRAAASWRSAESSFATVARARPDASRPSRKSSRASSVRSRGSGIRPRRAVRKPAKSRTPGRLRSRWRQSRRASSSSFSSFAVASAGVRSGSPRITSCAMA